MPHIDFYVLPENTEQSALFFACRLSAQLYRQQQKIYVYTRDEAQSVLMDQLLWQFKADSFLPHERLNPADHSPVSPVLIGETAPAVQIDFDVLINLSEHVPTFYTHFSRIVELAIQEENNLGRLREHYRFYRQQDCSLKTHHLQST